MVFVHRGHHLPTSILIQRNTADSLFREKSFGGKSKSERRCVEGGRLSRVNHYNIREKSGLLKLFLQSWRQSPGFHCWPPVSNVCGGFFRYTFMNHTAASYSLEIHFYDRDDLGLYVPCTCIGVRRYVYCTHGIAISCESGNVIPKDIFKFLSCLKGS